MPCHASLELYSWQNPLVIRKYEQSIEEWDVVLNMTIEEVAENGYGVRWAKKLLRNTQNNKIKFKQTCNEKQLSFRLNCLILRGGPARA